MRQQHFVLEPTFDFHQHIRTYTQTSYLHPRSKKNGGFMEPLGQWEKGSLLKSSSAPVLHLSIVLHFRSYKCDSCWWPKCEWDLTIEPDCEKNYYFTWKNYPLGLLLFKQRKAMGALACTWMRIFFKIVCVTTIVTYTLDPW